eukprot:989238-Pyramimonas_sp.AAC.1
MAPEITARVAKCLGSLRPIKASVAPRGALSLGAKTLFAEAIAASVLFYAAGVWPKLTSAQARKMGTTH